MSYINGQACLKRFESMRKWNWQYLRKRWKKLEGIEKYYLENFALAQLRRSLYV